MTVASSPASTGPAGSHFEGQVGAFYLLSMLSGVEPRGLPGRRIDRVEFQRGSEGRPLDDIIIHAHDTLGDPAVFEIQVKRSIKFTPSDPVFAKVVGQIVKASKRPDFWDSCYQLAIATAKTSMKIDGAYQDVLTWARHIGDPDVFMARINRSGLASDAMRRFVNTFKIHLQDADCPNDNRTVWGLLRRLQILIFDFTAQGSVSEELSKERVIRCLHPDDTMQASNLWKVLIELAVDVAASGGDRNLDELLEDLKNRPFRLAGQRNYTSVRKIIMESANHELEDIDDRVGGIKLARLEYVTKIHSALDTGRYVEIRGDAGVGKSGILKHFAQQVAKESPVIVLRPGRTVPRGWMAMRTTLGFDGSAKDLLSDIAASGGGILFVDNLDFFDLEERLTIVDLIREAVKTPGISIIATARNTFGIEEPPWIPQNLLTKIGVAKPVEIGELTDAEIDEIGEADHKLSVLLSKNHPASAVTRNLFRLNRLANQSPEEPFPRTEIDMAKRWWKTADGSIDKTHRERSRLLKGLAEQSIAKKVMFNVSAYPASVVDELIRNETLRDQGGDIVAFRHDVLCEWSIANYLNDHPEIIDQLLLDQPLSSAMMRGIELYARILVENNDEVAPWKTLFEKFSLDNVHGSWQRVVLLAIVRSEAGSENLKNMSPYLLANQAAILRELIHVVKAVDVKPLSQMLKTSGIDMSLIPSGINSPNGPSWWRLILWLLSLGESLPAKAIPDVVDFYSEWAIGTFGVDPITPLLIKELYRWMVEIDKCQNAASFHERRQPFGGKLDSSEVRALETNLRTSFLLFCNRTPDLAVDYIALLRQNIRNERVRHNIFKFQGTIVQAAPDEYSALILDTLIVKKQKKEPHRRGGLDRPFDYIDHQFHPPSPAQGPFYELLTHSPQNGLSVIKQLVDHAISFYCQDHEYGENKFTITFPEGGRNFPWTQSYLWSRENSAQNCISSALMALEAWSHKRIDAGEDISNVLDDIIGSSECPAAYLLIAVDIILSHWPESRESAIPFLSCPELLCYDTQRNLHDNFKYPDFFGLKVHEKEPMGAVSKKDLQNRPSRRFTLDQLLGQYAIHVDEKSRKQLHNALHIASKRLGPPNEKSTLHDPEFMAVYAINLIDPDNWQEVEIKQEDGSIQTALQYISPPEEKQHFQTLQEEAHDSTIATNTQMAITLATEDPSRTSPEFLQQAVDWAKSIIGDSSPDNSDKDEMLERAIITAAMISMRDGDEDFRKKHSGWARQIFEQTFQGKEDSVHRFRNGILYNPIAIAFVGMVHSPIDCKNQEDIRAILKVAANKNPAASHGFGFAGSKILSINEHLPIAILRCALKASIKPRRVWKTPEEEVAKQSKLYQDKIQTAINSEIEWLTNKGPEPEWPEFPMENVRRRKHIRLSVKGTQKESSKPQNDTVPNEYVDHQAAALWLKNAFCCFKASDHHYFLNILQVYSDWTAQANGSGLERHEDISEAPNEWNSAYFELSAGCLPQMALSEIETLALAPICSLPDQSFFDIATDFLQSVDNVYFNNSDLEESKAIAIRSTISDRLIESRGWERLTGSRTTSIEMHIGPLIAALFFNEHGFIQKTKCYLLPKGVDKLDPFFPVLEKLIKKGRSVFSAFVTLSLLEASPRPSHLPFLIISTQVWLQTFPDYMEFWVDHSIGRRICVLIEKIIEQEPEILDGQQDLKTDLNRIVASLTNLGIPEGYTLEKIMNQE
ncbi:MAG: ATP-binding protein [Proteobacteria bacterium]|nr:ATP-binding protein [Pseudomonadota bacterium]MBU1545079.1 ATP-binding protein [Pseudomonadota bacterium]